MIKIYLQGDSRFDENVPSCGKLYVLGILTAGRYYHGGENSLFSCYGYHIYACAPHKTLPEFIAVFGDRIDSYQHFVFVHHRLDTVKREGALKECRFLAGYLIGL